MTNTDVPDTIERSIDIDAPAETVWELISEPGWWINAGAIVAHEIRDAGDHVVVTDPVHGEFRLRAVSAHPPRHARFEWLGEDDGSTTVDFTIDARDGGVTLTVVERGFANLPGGLAERARRHADNVDGWATELAAAARHCDRLGVERAAFVPLAPTALWPLVATGDGLARWYAFGGATLEPRAGGAATLRWEEHGTFRATVEAIDAPHELALRIAADPEVDPTPATSSLARLTVTPAGDGSVVAVSHTGLDALPGDHAELAEQERQAWGAGLDALVAQAR